MQTTPMSSASVSAAVAEVKSEAQLKAEEIAAERAKQQAAKIQELRELIGKSHPPDLDLQGQKIDVQGVTEVIVPILTSPECKFTSVIIGNNDLGDAGAASFATILKPANNKLTAVNLAWNGIGDQGVTDLAAALLHHNCHLTELNLTKNNFGPIGIRAIIAALQNPNCNLTAIYLGTNNIGADDLRALANVVISRRRTPKPLNVYGIDELDALIAAAEKEDKDRAARLKAEHPVAIEPAPIKSEEKASAQPQSASDLKIERPVLAQSAMAIGSGVSASTATADEAKQKAEQEAAAEAKQRLQEIQQLVEKAIKDEETVLYLYQKNIGDEGAKIVATALQNPKCKFKSIALWGNNIELKGVGAIAAAILNPYCKLTSINLNWNNFGPEGTRIIANALQNSGCKLTSIHISYNNIGPEGVAAIAIALQNPNCKLTSIDLSSNDIGNRDAAVIAIALQNTNCKLTSVNLDGNNVGPEGARALAAALQNPNCKLTSINLWHNSIRSAGAVAIATALQNPNCKLISINLWENNIGNEGAIAIATALQNPNCKLTSIDLSTNNIGPEGITAIITALQNPSCSLSTINLRGNNIGPKDISNIVQTVIYRKKIGNPIVVQGVDNLNTLVAEVEKTQQLIEQALKNSTTELDLSVRDIGNEGSRVIAAALQDPRYQFTSVVLYWNKIGNNGAVLIANALRNPNCKITSIDLGLNNIEPDGISAIAAALQDPVCKLTSISLNGNFIGSTGAKAIAKAVAFRKKIGHVIQVTGIDDLDGLVAAVEKEEQECETKELQVTQQLAKANEEKLQAEQEAAAKAKQRLQEIQQLVEKAIKEGATKLYLFGKNIGNEGAKIVAAATQNPDGKLTSIFLGSNNIGPEGATAIAAALQNPNCKLTSIFLGSNNIGPEGAIAIATALQSPNCKLASIDLDSNNIGPEGATAIAAALQNPNCKLTSIALWVNKIGPEGARALAQAMVFRRKAGRPIEVIGIDNFDTLVAAIEKEDQERNEEEQKIKEAIALAQENLAKAENSIIAADLKTALPVLLVDLQPQTATQTLQQLADLVAIVTPPISQSLDETQLKEITAAFAKTIVSIRNDFPYQAALLEAQFRLGMSRQLYDDQNATEASLKQAVGFANQALQALQAINLGAERKDSRIARKNCKLGEAYRLLGDINYKMLLYGQVYKQQAIAAYQAALKILPNDQIAAKQLDALSARSTFVARDIKKTGESSTEQMERLTEDFPI